MARNRARVPLPESFETIEEFDKFWDTHDTEDYPEAWREVQFSIAMKSRRYPRIILEPGVARQLDKRARAQGVSVNELVNRLLKETLRHSES